MDLLWIAYPSGYQIFAVSLAISFASAMVTKLLVGEKMKASREKTKEYQKKLKDAQKSKDMEKMKKVQAEFMKHMMESMQHTMKPMLVTMIPFILVFAWLFSTFGASEMDYFGIIHLEGHGGDYLFEWNDATGNNTTQFEQFLENEMKVDWVNYAEINKSEDNKNITVTYGAGLLTAKLDEEKKKVKVEYGDLNRKYILKKENNDLNVYVERNVATLLGIKLSWFWWYLASILPISIIINKLLGNS